MFFFLLRWSPLATALVAWIVAAWQWRFPLMYPWPLLLAMALYSLAVFCLSFRRLSWYETVSKMLPAFLLLSTIGFSFIMASTQLERWSLSFLFSGVMYVSLELLFFLARVPGRYPVKGLSRLNLAFVLLAIFFFVLAFTGAMVFVHAAWWIGALVLTVCGMLWILSTMHASARGAEQGRWALFGGGLLAFQIALLLFIMPVSLVTQGVLAALLFFIPLRLRRYGYAPVPSRRFGWSEGLVGTVVFILILGGAHWI